MAETVPTMAEFDALDARVTALENASGGLVTSPDGATITTPGVRLIDYELASWELTGAGPYQIMKDGTLDPITKGVVKGVIQHNGVFYQLNDKGAWYTQNDAGHWVQVSDPTVAPPTSGIYQVRNGRIFAPNGNEWIGTGVCVLDAKLPDINVLMRLLPKVNHIRLACGFGDGFPDAQPISTLCGWIDNALSLYPQLCIGPESHVHDQKYGNQIDLAGEAQWYGQLANHFARQPRCFFGTGNELRNPVSAEQRNVYDAVRNAGCPNPIFLCGVVGQVGQAAFPETKTPYQTMKNAVSAQHFYNNATGGSEDINAVSAQITHIAQQMQAWVNTADGPLPVVWDEFGFLNYMGPGSPDVDVGGTKGTNTLVRAICTTGKAAAGSGPSGCWIWEGKFFFGSASTDLFDAASGSLTQHGIFYRDTM